MPHSNVSDVKHEEVVIKPGEECECGDTGTRMEELIKVKAMAALPKIWDQ